MYGSAMSGIDPAGENVTPIQPGESVVIPSNNDRAVFLLGTGDAAVLSGNKEFNFFKPAPKGGGGSGDGITQQQLNDTLKTYATNTSVDTKLEEYASKDEIPASLPADGGNADTVGGKSAEELIQSNPNLLLNPDFKVNQRGETIFNGSTNSNAMDRWQIPSDTLAAYTENGIKITNNRSEGQQTWFYQDIGTNLTGRELTVSVCAKGTGKISIGYINGPNDQFDLTNEYHIYSYSFIPQQLLEGWEHIFGMYLYGSETYVKWIKLEFGGVATPFVPPNPLKEALKCGPLKNAEQQIFYGDGRWANAPSNPNLLDNPDFKINQRGQSEYTGITYTVDRWRMFDLSSRIEVVNSGIKITTLTAAGTNSNTNALFQLLNHPVDTYSGKQLTLSLKATDTTGPWAICIRFGKSFPSGDYVTAIYQRMFSGVNRWTFTVPDQAISMRIGIIQHGPYGSTVGDTITVEWIKLELGSVATPFVPPNPATELVKCQRYFQLVDVECNTRTGHVDGHSVQFKMPLPIKMRIDPTILNADKIMYEDGYGVGEWKQPDNSTHKIITGIKSDYAFIRLVSSNIVSPTDLLKYQIHVGSYSGDFDARLQLSADL